MFQHTAARRRLPIFGFQNHKQVIVSTHSRPKAAAAASAKVSAKSRVSTHSRPKAAAVNCPTPVAPVGGFNTQPPEGGCDLYPELHPLVDQVSTHSRPKAAAPYIKK